MSSYLYFIKSFYKQQQLRLPFCIPSATHDVNNNEVDSKDEIRLKKTIESSRLEEPNKSIKELVNVGLVYFAIELMFSIEVALTVPLMLKLKVSEDIYSYVYFISPLIGFIVQPILGAYSDKCGKRKPFIFILAIGAYVGIFLILNGYLIGQYMGDRNSYSPLIAISLVGIGVTILDFSADSCDSPLRAYLLDVCNSKAQETGLNIHAFLGGLGASLGYILTYIEWENTFFAFIGDELQILFLLTSLVFVYCLYVTMSSVKEKNYNKTKAELLLDEPTISNCDASDIGFKTIFSLFSNIPPKLKRLVICQILGWLAFFSTELFFTDFVAQSIYKGNPSSPIESMEFKLYNAGVKMGCMGLLIFSLSSSFSAVIVEKFFIQRISIKSLYLITFVLYVICCIIIYYLNNIYLIMPFCSSFGLLFTILTTLPYQLISDFHQDSEYLYYSGTKRGIGTDCSLLGSCFFLAQAIISIFMSYLTCTFGNRVILIVAAGFGTIGLIFTHFFVFFPQKPTIKMI